MLKEAVLRTGCLDAVTSVSGGDPLGEGPGRAPALGIYAYGTNTGIKAVASGGHGHTEDELRYVRRRYLSVEAAHAIQIANATFAARSTDLWARARPRLPPTPPTCAPTTRTCSPSGTRATAA
ncbi:Tn3 family transposase, partial [Streptomyces sp. NPDC127197]|uniref:Tn3 family transposase n=1 Tax=Streptomyces sp. NPDC127197 TaxID=3345388 RepID=UPI00363E7CBE